MRKIILVAMALALAFNCDAVPRRYRSGGSVRMQRGYVRKNGTYVSPHMKTRPDNSRYNNLGRGRRVR